MPGVFLDFALHARSLLVMNMFCSMPGVLMILRNIQISTAVTKLSPICNLPFFCRAKRDFFFQNSTLGYMTKTLNQIIFFSSTKIRIFCSATLNIFLVIFLIIFPHFSYSCICWSCFNLSSISGDY
jgi:hypothetical protein